MPTLEETIDYLVENDVDSIIYQENTDYLADILRTGFKGYEAFSGEKLEGEYAMRIEIEAIMVS